MDRESLDGPEVRGEWTVNPVRARSHVGLGLTSRLMRPKCLRSDARSGGHRVVWGAMVSERVGPFRAVVQHVQEDAAHVASGVDVPVPQRFAVLVGAPPQAVNSGSPSSPVGVAALAGQNGVKERFAVHQDRVAEGALAAPLAGEALRQDHYARM